MIHVKESYKTCSRSPHIVVLTSNRIANKAKGEINACFKNYNNRHAHMHIYQYSKRIQRDAE